jgi:metal-responsive CopG/Arc/MetJ family transcriptional regulator
MAGKPWISVQLDAEMKRDLDEYCATNDVVRSDLIRDFISSLLYDKTET